MLIPAFIGGLGPPELIIILVVLLLLFGSRLPSMMRGLGKSVTEFKRGMNEITDETMSEEPPRSQAPRQDSREQAQRATDEGEKQGARPQEEDPSEGSPAG